ncbi:hypothetical protein MBANPS3_000587 [Mucor bainieri]
MLLEIGIQPAISSVAETIVGTTLSKDHFGLYHLSALFVTGAVDLVHNAYCSYSIKQYLEERCRSLIQTHRQELAVLLVNEETEHAAVRQYLVRQNFTHVSSSSLFIDLVIQTNKSAFSYGCLDEDASDAYYYLDLPGTYLHDKLYSRAKYFFKTECTLLSIGDYLPSTGLKRTFLLPKCIGADMNYHQHVCADY